MTDNSPALRTLWLTCPGCGRNLAAVRADTPDPARPDLPALDVRAAGSGIVHTWRAYVDDPALAAVLCALEARHPEDIAALRGAAAGFERYRFECRYCAAHGRPVAARKTRHWIRQVWSQEATRGERVRRRSLVMDPPHSDPTSDSTDVVRELVEPGTRISAPLVDCMCVIGDEMILQLRSDPLRATREIAFELALSLVTRYYVTLRDGGFVRSAARVR